MSSSAINTQRCKISDLPEEILQTIFKLYLSTNERKTVKLVCKAWLETCNIPFLSNDEVLNCLGVYQTSDICALLDNSKREVLNLRFQNVKFSDTHSSFWQKNGPKIQSIHFIDCEFQNGVFMEIIIFCENLLHLSFVFTSRYKTFGIVSPPIIVLDEVLRDDIIRENLKSLEIDIVDSEWISNFIVHQIFTIFPNVQVLKISCKVVDLNFEKIFLDSSELTSKTNFTFAPILNYLMASSDRIEKLKLHFPYNYFSMNFLNRIFETMTAMTRLTELSIHMRGSPESEYVETFIRSKQLKSLEFSMALDTPFEEFLQLLLSNSNLQFLKISFFDLLTVSHSFFQKLVSPSLKSLHISDPISVADSMSTSESYLSSPNTVLQNLSLCVDRIHMQRDFVENLKNLHHLKARITWCCFESILKNQAELKSLIYDYQYPILPPSFFGLDYGQWINRLAIIEYLNLPATCGYIFSMGLVSANLKYMYLRIDNAVYPQVFRHELLELTNSMPFLKGLFVGYNDDDDLDSVDFWLELCVKLPRLQYLCFKRGFDDGLAKEFKEKDFEKIFSVCPSLRAMVYDSENNHTPLSCYFDTIMKKAVLKNDNYKYSLGKPRIGEITIDWLNF